MPQATGDHHDDSRTHAPVDAIAVACLDPRQRERAQLVAATLRLACLDRAPDNWRAATAFGLLLLVDAQGLALGQTGAGRMLPVRVDLADPALLHRVGEKGARQQDIARAIGVNQRRDLHVIDGTAGWGRDSALLAALGCTVTMIERQPVIAALLDDGLARARESRDARVRGWAGRLELRHGDATALLDAMPAPAADVILLDPMFPERDGHAAVRKEMQLFHALVGDDADAPRLLAAALSHARYRVVVKRPRKAPALAGTPPGFAIEGRSTRFDVYPLRALK